MSYEKEEIIFADSSDSKRSSCLVQTFCVFDNVILPLSIICGVIVGASIPGNSDLSSNYRPVSSIIGWIYFFSWTFSFYPQIIQNFSRKTSMGLAPDKILYDLLGFSCLSIYSVAFFYVPSVRESYAVKNGGNYPKVQINDVFFALHAFLMTIVQICQMTHYDGWKQCPSRLSIGATSTVVLITLIYLGIVASGSVAEQGVFSLLDWLYFLSFIKMGVTMVKYIPQVLHNYVRKSTEGWNITGCIMDLDGGVLSQLQLILDCNDTHDWGGITGDLVKLVLGAVSTVFDVIFIVQHYVLYPHNQYSSLNQSDSPLLINDYDSEDPDHYNRSIN